MKGTLRIDDSTSNKISLYFLIAFLALLPFDYFYSQVAVIGFAIHTLIHLEQERIRLLKSKPVLIMTGLYLLGLIGIIYSPDPPEAWAVAGRQAAMFFMPVLLVLNPLDLQRYKLVLIKALGFTCTIVVLYLYFDAVKTILYFDLPLSAIISRGFINHNFSLPIGMHATYLSLYVALSVICFLYLMLQGGFRWGYFICSCILAAGLVQLSSRAVVISLLVVINFVMPFFIPEEKKRTRFIVIAGLASIATLLIALSVLTFKLRYVASLKNDLTQTAVNHELIEPRAKRWNIILGLVKRSPIVGYGSGSEKELLKEAYFRNKLYVSYLEQFNAHSQYFSFLIKTGIIGLLAYAYVLFFGVSLAIRRKDMLFLAFMCLIIIVSVSENILDVNKGVFFYSFFLALFTLANSPEIQPKRQPQ